MRLLSPPLLVTFNMCNFLLCLSMLAFQYGRWQYELSWSGQYRRRQKKHLFMFTTVQSVSAPWNPLDYCPDQRPSVKLPPVQPCCFGSNVRVKHYTKQPTSLFGRGSCMPGCFHTSCGPCPGTHSIPKTFSSGFTQINCTHGSSVLRLWARTSMRKCS